MTIRTRRTLVLLGGVSILLLGTASAFFGGELLARMLAFLVPPGEPGQNLNPHASGDVYWRLSFFSMSIVGALSFGYLFWTVRPTKRASQFAYCALLAVLFPMSAVNFATGDNLMHRWAQVLLDLALVFVGLVTAIYLARLRPMSAAGAALQSMIMFLVVLQAVFLPGVFALL